MTVRDEDIRQQLRLGEDSRWEFKEVRFSGSRPVSPTRDDFADEMIAFANGNGGLLLCGATDDGHLQGLSRQQVVALSMMLAEVGTDTIEPALRVEAHNRELDGKAFVLVDVPRGDSLHERRGRSFIRVGPSKRILTTEERMRLAQRRARHRYLWFDEQAVPGTGLETLHERLWEPLLSATGAADPARGLESLRLAVLDDAGVLRATVAGVLLCTRNPHELLPGAAIMATHYAGTDRASGQLDAQEIVGPLQQQIADAVRFVARNMRVAARKEPARENVPQYSAEAVFEAVTNAVAHRDYSVAARRIRLSMFADRLEIDSPGVLPNGMTVESMEASQATRNEVIASVFGRVPVGDVPGSAHRQFLMERRGDGVSIILNRTWETAGAQATYRLVDGKNLVVDIPAARLEPTAGKAAIRVHDGEASLPDVDVLALYPDATWRRGSTGEDGTVTFDLPSTHLPMTVFSAAHGLAAGRHQAWVPEQGNLELQTDATSGGSVVFADGNGHLPGLRGRLNPFRDAHDRTCLYADGISIDQGRPQPTPIRLGRPIRITDTHGFELTIRVIDIVGRAALVEYQNA